MHIKTHFLALGVQVQRKLLILIWLQVRGAGCNTELEGGGGAEMPSDQGPRLKLRTYYPFLNFHCYHHLLLQGFYRVVTMDHGKFYGWHHELWQQGNIQGWYDDLWLQGYLTDPVQPWLSYKHLRDSFIHSFINSVSDHFPPNLQNTTNPKPLDRWT